MGCDWEFIDEFKHFRIFEKLMNLEISEKIEVHEFIFGANVPFVDFISSFEFT